MRVLTTLLVAGLTVPTIAAKPWSNSLGRRWGYDKDANKDLSSPTSNQISATPIPSKDLPSLVPDKDLDKDEPSSVYFDDKDKDLGSPSPNGMPATSTPSKDLPSPLPDKDKPASEYPTDKDQDDKPHSTPGGYVPEKDKDKTTSTRTSPPDDGSSSIQVTASSSSTQGTASTPDNDSDKVQSQDSLSPTMDDKVTITSTFDNKDHLKVEASKTSSSDQITTIPDKDKAQTATKIEPSTLTTGTVLPVSDQDLPKDDKSSASSFDSIPAKDLPKDDKASSSGSYSIPAKDLPEGDKTSTSGSYSIPNKDLLKDDKTTTVPDKDKPSSSEPATSGGSKSTSTISSDDKKSSTATSSDDKSSATVSLTTKFVPSSTTLAFAGTPSGSSTFASSTDKASPTGSSSTAVVSMARSLTGKLKPSDKDESSVISESSLSRLTLSLTKPDTSSSANITASVPEFGPIVLTYSVTLVPVPSSSSSVTLFSSKAEVSGSSSRVLTSKASLASSTLVSSLFDSSTLSIRSSGYLSKPEASILGTGGITSKGSVFPSKPSLTVLSTVEITSFPGYSVVPSPSEEATYPDKASYKNTTSPLTPVWTQPMLGNGYGGGFVITPSIYVTKVSSSNESSSQLPPGYGSPSHPETLPITANVSKSASVNDKGSRIQQTNDKVTTSAMVTASSDEGTTALKTNVTTTQVPGLSFGPSKLFPNITATIVPGKDSSFTTVTISSSDFQSLSLPMGSVTQSGTSITATSPGQTKNEDKSTSVKPSTANSFPSKSEIPSSPGVLTNKSDAVTLPTSGTAISFSGKSSATTLNNVAESSNPVVVSTQTANSSPTSSDLGPEKPEVSSYGSVVTQATPTFESAVFLTLLSQPGGIFGQTVNSDTSSLGKPETPYTTSAQKLEGMSTPSIGKPETAQTSLVSKAEVSKLPPGSDIGTSGYASSVDSEAAKTEATGNTDILITSSAILPEASNTSPAGKSEATGTNDISKPEAIGSSLLSISEGAESQGVGQIDSSVIPGASMVGTPTAPKLISETLSTTNVNVPRPEAPGSSFISELQMTTIGASEESALASTLSASIAVSESPTIVKPEEVVSTSVLVQPEGSATQRSEYGGSVVPSGKSEVSGNSNTGTSGIMRGIAETKAESSPPTTPTSMSTFGTLTTETAVASLSQPTASSFSISGAVPISESPRMLPGASTDKANGVPSEQPEASVTSPSASSITVASTETEVEYALPTSGVGSSRLILNSPISSILGTPPSAESSAVAPEATSNGVTNSPSGVFETSATGNPSTGETVASTQTEFEYGSPSPDAGRLESTPTAEAETTGFSDSSAVAPLNPITLSAASSIRASSLLPATNELPTPIASDIPAGELSAPSESALFPPNTVADSSSPVAGGSQLASTPSTLASYGPSSVAATAAVAPLSGSRQAPTPSDSGANSPPAVGVAGPTSSASPTAQQATVSMTETSLQASTVSSSSTPTAEAATVDTTPLNQYGSLSSVTGSVGPEATTLGTSSPSEETPAAGQIASNTDTQTATDLSFSVGGEVGPEASSLISAPSAETARQPSVSGITTVTGSGSGGNTSLPLPFGPTPLPFLGGSSRLAATNKGTGVLVVFALYFLL